MSEEKIKWFDVPTVSDRPLPEKALAMLRNMVESGGWQVFLELSHRRAEEAAVTALDLNAPDAARAEARYLYASALYVLTFADRLRDATPCPPPDQQAAIEPPQDNALPSYARMWEMLKKATLCRFSRHS